MAQYYHAHKIVLEKCRGHMACMRRCPTQAIRVRGGKAFISEELCVDCGTCMSACTAGAIVSVTDSVGELSNFKYKVVVPSSALYSQFDSSLHPYIIHLAFRQLGFDAVVDLGQSCAAWARAMIKFLKEYRGRLPLISSDCPSMLRLIQVRYPDLVDLIVPLDVPREVTAREIKRRWPSKLGLKSEDIGILHVVPCPSRIVSIKQPAEKARSWFDAAVSIKDVYSVLLPHIAAIKENFDESMVPKDFNFAIGWAALGGITRSVPMENWLAVSGLDHVMKILDDIENSRLRNVDFVEARACMQGCVGGSFNVENPYVARTNSIKQRAKYNTPPKFDDDEINQKLEEGYFFLENAVLPRPTKYFDTDLETSIKRMKEKERVYQKLRQTDCGCCGAPTCMAFAEDFARGEANLTDCIFLSNLGGEK